VNYRSRSPSMVRPLSGCSGCGQLGSVGGASSGVLLLAAAAGLVFLFPKVWKNFLKSL